MSWGIVTATVMVTLTVTILEFSADRSSDEKTQ